MYWRSDATIGSYRGGTIGGDCSIDPVRTPAYTECGTHHAEPRLYSGRVKLVYQPKMYLDGTGLALTEFSAQ
jgi:hypothetical protein